MLTDTLKELNFSPNQIKVYLSLFDLGEARAGQLSKETGLHRHIVYTVLDELISRKLVTEFIKGKIQYYQALDPEPLILELEAKQKLAKQAVKDLRSRGIREAQEITIYEGFKGIKEHRLATFAKLKKGDEILILGASSGSNEPLEEFWAKFHRQRSQAGVNCRMFWTQDAHEAGEDRASIPRTKVKYLNEELTNPMMIEVTKDNVGLALIREKNPFLISINDKDTAESFRHYFNLLWKKAK